MQGGVIGGICLLTFLLSVGRAEEVEGLKELEDPKEDLREIKEKVDVKQSSESKAPDDLKTEISLAVTESNSQEDERSGAMAHSSAHSFGGSSISNAVAQSNGGGSSSAYSDGFGGSAQSKATAIAGGDQDSPISPFGTELNPYIRTGSSLSQAEAQAISDSGSSYGQGLNSYPYFSSYPYSSGSSSAQAQNEANNEYYQPAPIPTSNLSPYNQASSSAQAQALPENGYYQPSGSATSISSPYNQGSSSAQAQTVAENGYYQPSGGATPILSPYNQGSSSAQAQTVAENGYYQPSGVATPILSPYNQGSSSAQAQTVAENGLYQPVFTNSPTLSPYNQGSSSAQAQTLAENGYYQPSSVATPILSPYNQGSSSAQAQTVAENGYYQPSGGAIPIFRPYNQASSSAQAQTVAENGLYQPGFINSPNLSPYNQGSSSAQVQAQADRAAAAQAYADVRPGASGVVNPYSQGISPYANDYPSESPYRPAGYNQAGNEAQEPPNFFGSGQSSPIAFEDAKSRIIFPNEYVFPNKMRGGENTIQCSKENEFHHFWSRGLDCLVCICLNEYGLLTPVCASCGGCHKPSPRLPEPIAVQPASPEPFTITPEPYPFVPQPEPNPLEPIPEPYQPPRPEPHPLYPEPIPAPSPGPVPFPAPIPTLPPVPAEATCNPLPNGTPFTNPLHPCQICVCRESYMSGKPDVQIQCKENPQCIVPDDVTTLPPLPDVPVPIPLPMCEKFPEHVLFPHPTDGCRLCKCSKSLSESGLIEQQITCYPHPDCVAKPEAISGPEPVEPLREPFGQMKPVPLPEIVTVEPLSWPPITTIAPVPTLLLTPRPGPLPGPSPHESCRPYPPNQPFQHPWDDCQICLCAEAYAIGMVTVEVNCYTKPSCCIEPPESLKPAVAGFSQQYPGFSNAVNGPDIQALSNGLAPGIIITSTYRPPTIYPSYNSRPVNIYPGNNQVIGAEVPIQPQGYPPAQYPRLQTDDAFANANAASSYNYQPNYNPGYVSQQYPEYPPRLPAPTNTIGSYKQKNYGFIGNYQYEQGDAMESGYPGPRGHFQPYAPRYQGIPSPNAYPPQYQRPNYEMPPMYYTPRQVRDNYALAQASAQGGPNGLSLASAQGYAIETRGRTKTDGPEDIDSSQ